jgi:hypothetical protein
LLVFHGRPLPAGALSAEQVVESWIAAARRQLAAGHQAALRSALLHALAFGAPEPVRRAPARPRRLVVLASADEGLEHALVQAGFEIRRVRFTPFDAAAAAKVRHFDTYNRGAASRRVADLVDALAAAPGAALVADGEAALAGLLAAAVVPVPLAILDVDAFDVASDAAFLEQLDIPGLRRAGDLQTAAGMARGTLVIHNAGERFRLQGVAARASKLADGDIVGLLRRD